MPKLSFQISSSANQTKQTAKILVKKLVKKISRKNALILALIGDLGSGKTTFAQGFLREVGIKRKITSPTFILIRRYKLKAKKYKLVYHIDCYRIHKPNELLKLGFKDIIGGSQNIVLIEWADKIRRILPKNAIWIHFKHGEKLNQRIIKIL